MDDRQGEQNDEKKIGQSSSDTNDLNGELMDASVHHKDGLSDSEALQPQSRVDDGMSDMVRDVNMIKNLRLLLRAIHTEHAEQIIVIIVVVASWAARSSSIRGLVAG